MTVLPAAILEGGGLNPALQCGVRHGVRGETWSGGESWSVGRVMECGVPSAILKVGELNPAPQCGEECRAESWMKTQSMI